MGAVVLALTFFAVSVLSAKDSYKPAVKYENPKPTPVLTVENGRLSGVYTEDEQVRVYAGIPYAEPPVGNLRWKAPVPSGKWDGVRVADHFGAIAMQKRAPLIVAQMVAKAMGQKAPEFQEMMSEDCLYLNVWAPASPCDTLRPVLVFIHEGALRTGSGSEDYCCGEEAARNGVVMVTVNYRLGVFGFLALPELSSESGQGSGNYGLLDQIEALRWIQRNIKSFGGDPKRVTIAGESAGSQSVSALCASPLARGLFHAAIGESATFACPWLASDIFTQEKSERIGTEFMQKQKVHSVAELRAIPADKIVDSELSEVSLTIDGYALPKSVWQTYVDGEQSDVPLLIGYNAKEGGLFTIGQDPTPEELRSKLIETFGEAKGMKILALYPVTNKKEAKQALVDIVGAFAIGWPTDRWAYIANKTGSEPVFRYYYTHKQETALGANHGTEMQFAYYNPDAMGKWDDADYKFARRMFNYWINFVKHGHPGEQWQTYDKAPTDVMELGDHFGMIPEPNQKLFDILMSDE